MGKQLPGRSPIRVAGRHTSMQRPGRPSRNITTGKTAARMPKVQNLKPSITTLSNPLAPTHATTQAKDRYRDHTQPWRAWYRLARWTRLRLKVFLRDGYTCRMCGKLQGDTSKLACDHKEPHRGDPVKFWDENNCQTLCADPCHNTHKKLLEQRAILSRSV